ncbi:MAG: VWA domain-containing protein [Planctomycetes bacterium]|nr:VWA domain-containing protein [Planctomycetota bacterium]
MTPRFRFLAPLCAVALALAAARAQDVVPFGSSQQSALVARALREWTAAFEQGRLGARAVLQRGVERQPAYVAPARAAGYVTERDETNITHTEALQKLMQHAEKRPDGELGAALLGIAAIGLEGAFLDRDAIELRELGHAALLRVDEPRVWSMLLRAAAGDRMLLGSQGGVDGRADAPVAPGPARRVAALRLLAARGRPAWRATIEDALTDVDPRVRLGAAEALAAPWRVEAMRAVAGALAAERHPVVSQALVRLVLDARKQPPEDVDEEALDLLVTEALARFGRCGWRTDMDLLDLVEAFPRKAHVPLLIDALTGAARAPDKLVGAVNKSASPLLRQRLVELLRAMTGAIVAGDTAPGWREFWAREGERVVVPDPLVVQRDEGTRATFYGVPVAGGETAFLIDVSGSMGDDVDDAAMRQRRLAPTRLTAAKEQLLQAAQAMPPGATMQIYTFAEQAKAWTPTPITPTPQSLRSLTELLSRLRAHGGTDLHAGLAQALQVEARRFGEPTAAMIDELFVLSDGVPTVGDMQDAEPLLREVREANKYAKVRIHCVFTGDGRGADLLRALAAQNGGVFVQR